MMTKTLFSTSLLLSLLSLSIAHAGTTISDARYWPNAALSIPQGRSSVVDAQAGIQNPAGAQTPYYVYQGGPKTGVLVHR